MLINLILKRKQREEELKKFRKYSTEEPVRKNKFYDDVFDNPE